MMRSSAVFLALALWCAPQAVFADFDLPILYPVSKTLVVTEDISEQQLVQLASIEQLTLEIHMVGGNMLRDVTIERLNRLLPKITKRVVLKGEINKTHVRQLARLAELEIGYQLGPQGLSDKTFNALFELGPVRKFIYLPGNSALRDLKRFRRLKVFVPVFPPDPGPLDAASVEWLSRRKLRGISFVLAADLEPVRVYDRIQFRPVELIVKATRNRIRPGLLAVLKDLRGVDLTVVVDGRLTLEDVREMASLERFSLRVELGSNGQYTPGLPALLNRVAPPAR
jgi:hypothetical protein